MILNDYQLDWITHSISLTAATCAMNAEAYARAYPGVLVEHHQHVLDIKRQALAALRAGVSMDAEVRGMADYLLAYAEAHEYLYGVDDALFHAAMARARQRALDALRGKAA